MIAKRYDDELMYSVQKCDDDSSNKYIDLVKNYEENTFEQNGEKFEQITLF